MIFYAVKIIDRFGDKISARAVLQGGVWVVTVSEYEETEDRFEAVEYSGIDALNMTLFNSVGDTGTLADYEGYTVLAASSSVEEEESSC